METILRKSAERDKRITKGQRNAKLTEPEYNCDCDDPKEWRRFLENRQTYTQAVFFKELVTHSSDIGGLCLMK